MVGEIKYLKNPSHVMSLRNGIYKEIPQGKSTPILFFFNLIPDTNIQVFFLGAQGWGGALKAATRGKKGHKEYVQPERTWQWAATY